MNGRNDHPGAASGTAPAPDCTLVIFGAGGDLTKRLLMPALYNLAGAGLLGQKLGIIGVDHVQRADQEWIDDLSATMESFTKDPDAEFHTDRIDPAAWGWVTQRLSYLTADFEQPESYQKLKQRLDAIAHQQGHGSVVFYLAVSARFFGPIVDHLGAAGLLKEEGDDFRRVIIEKPFGADLPSAQALNRRVLKVMDEGQVFRIDHFLGKETVQSIMAVRFANGLFEPVWRSEHIDHVQITAAETIGVEERGAFYEPTGALRDMVPNHLFQLLAMTAIEAPAAFEAEAVRDEKARLIEAMPPVRIEDVVRAQYGAGSIQGADVRGYRQESHVAPDSHTETFVALKLAIDSKRWAGVPFYLRTGKRLKGRRTEIAVHLKPAATRLFQAVGVEELTPNVLTLQIDPTQGQSMTFSAKVPGPVMRLGQVRTAFQYHDFFSEKPNVGYETLIYDCMLGDAILFQRADAIEAAWAAVQPALDGWAKDATTLETYAAGSEGPEAAAALLERDGRSWLPLGS